MTTEKRGLRVMRAIDVLIAARSAALSVSNCLIQAV
jgi:hypothetical protein